MSGNGFVDLLYVFLLSGGLHVEDEQVQNRLNLTKSSCAGFR